MKKSILATTIIVTLALTGCDDSSSDNGSNPIVEPTTREVSVSVLQKHVGDMGVASEDQINYDRGAQLCGYTLTVSDDRGVFSKEDICIEDNYSTVVDVAGVGSVVIDYPETATGPTYEEFHLDGSANIALGETSISVTMSNTEFGYVTLDASNDVGGAELAGQEMFTENGYSYGYIKENSEIVIDAYRLELPIKDIAPYKAGQHVKYTVHFDENGNLVIRDGFGEPIDMPIVDPVISSSDMVGAEITGYDYAGVTNILINSESAKAAIAIDARNIKTLKQHSVNVGNDRNPSYEPPFEVEQGFDMYVNIFMGDSCSATDEGNYVYHIDTGSVYHKKHDLEYSNWNEFVGAKGDTPVKLCTEIPTGNFFLRMKDVDGASLVNTEFRISRWGK